MRVQSSRTAFPERRQGSRRRTVPPGILMAIGFAVVLWMAIRAVFSPDRGIEPADEGLAFLFVEHPERPTGGLPGLGWMTRPLWILAGGDVADYRTIAIWLLLTISALIGMAAVRAAQVSGPHDALAPRMLDAWLGLVTGATAGALFYATGPLVRTPSYDWVNVFGLTVSALGLLLALRRDEGGVPDAAAPWGSLLIGGALMGVGALVTLGGRPSSAAAVVTSGLLVIAALRGPRIAALMLPAMIGAPAAVTTGMILAGIWPRDVMVRLAEPVLTISGREDGSILRAIEDLARLPVDLIVAGPALLLLAVVPLVLRTPPSPRIERLLMTAAGLALVGWVMLEVTGPPLVRALHAGSGPPRLVAALGGRTDLDAQFYVELARSVWRRSAFVLTLALAIGAMIAGSRGRRREWLSLGLVFTGIVLGASSVPPLGGERLGAALMLVTAGSALPAAIPRPSGGSGVDEGSPPDHPHPHPHLRRRWLPALALLAVSLVSGFGSFARPAWQFSRAAPLVVAACVLMVGLHPRGSRRPALVVLMTAVVVVSAFQIDGSRDHPYRSRPISEQTVPIEVGPRGAPLLLDEEMARLLGSLQDSALAAGWESGTMLWEIPIRSTPLLAWHLDADLASNFALWWGGTTRLDETFGRIDAAEWSEAWLLTSATTLTEPVDLERREEVVLDVTSRLGTVFPDDYERVWTFASDRRWLNLELWRPIRADSAG